MCACGCIRMLSCVNCRDCVHEGVARRGGEEQVMTKCILAQHLSVCVIWRPRVAEVLTEERQVLGSECVCAQS